MKFAEWVGSEKKFLNMFVNSNDSTYFCSPFLGKNLKNNTMRMWRNW